MTVPPLNPKMPKPIVLPQERRIGELNRGGLTSPQASVPGGARFPRPNRPNGYVESPAGLREQTPRQSSFPAGDVLPQPIADTRALDAARYHNQFTPFTGEAPVELPRVQYGMDEGLRRQANQTAFGADLAPRAPALPEPGPRLSNASDSETKSDAS